MRRRSRHFIRRHILELGRGRADRQVLVFILRMNLTTKIFDALIATFSFRRCLTFYNKDFERTQDRRADGRTINLRTKLAGFAMEGRLIETGWGRKLPIDVVDP